MNRHGETFEERPLPGEYKVCPLHGCRYKLLVGPPDVTMTVRVMDWNWTLGLTLDEVVAETVRREMQRQEDLIKAHLKTHKMTDFYTTMAWFFQEYREKVGKLEKLLDLVFHATATQEPDKDGG